MKCLQFLKTFFIAILVIICDQLTKLAAQHFLQFGVPHPVFSFLNFTLAYNNGAAFSFLGGDSHWQVYILSAISLIVSVVVSIILWKLPEENSSIAARVKNFFCKTEKNSVWLWITFNLLLGGAVGNLIDRVFQHRVTDFIDFHIGAWHYATFNVADSAVSVAAVLLVFELFGTAKRANCAG